MLTAVPPLLLIALASVFFIFLPLIGSCHLSYFSSLEMRLPVLLVSNPSNVFTCIISSLLNKRSPKEPGISGSK